MNFQVWPHASRAPSTHGLREKRVSTKREMMKKKKKSYLKQKFRSAVDYHKIIVMGKVMIMSNTDVGIINLHATVVKYICPITFMCLEELQVRVLIFLILGVLITSLKVIKNTKRYE